MPLHPHPFVFSFPCLKTLEFQLPFFVPSCIHKQCYTDVTFFEGQMTKGTRAGGCKDAKPGGHKGMRVQGHKVQGQEGAWTGGCKGRRVHKGNSMQGQEGARTAGCKGRRMQGWEGARAVGCRGCKKARAPKETTQWGSYYQTKAYQLS